MKSRALAAAVLTLAVATPARAEPAADPDPWCGRDKGLHFAASAAIAGAGYGSSAFVVDDVAGRAVLGVVLAVSATLAKEVLDAAGLGTPSARDFAWGVAGAAVGVGISVTIDLSVRPSAPRRR